MDDENINNEEKLNSEIEKLEFEMNSTSPNGEVSLEFLMLQQAHQIKILIEKIKVLEQTSSQQHNINSAIYQNIALLWKNNTLLKKRVRILFIGLGISVISLLMQILR